MKVKKYLSVFAVVCAGALTLAGCSDYDNGYNENAIKFQEAFKETFGDIDPEQDWNLAERATVTVNTQTESNIKIYARMGSEYVIVGDYKGVNGTRMLGVDVVEGTRNLMVTDGRTAQRCAPGDVVVFNGIDTRTTHEGQTGIVNVSKLTAEKTYLREGDETWYPKYRYSDSDEYQKVVEGTVKEGAVNLNRVTNNFSYVSTGPFIIYPYYWNTSSKNTVGIYYYDNSGTRQEVPVYTMKEGDEVMYEDAYPEETTVNTEEAILDNWTIDSGQSLARNTWSSEENGIENGGMQKPFIQYWVTAGNDLPNATIRHKTITGLTPGHYIVKIHARMFNESNAQDQPTGITFFANGKEFPMNQWEAASVLKYKLGENNRSSYVRHGNIELKEVKVEADGKLDLGFTVDGAEGNWLAFKDLEVIKMGSYVNPEARNSYSAKYVRGQGILVDIPEGTKFGMYLYSRVGGSESNTITYYSQAELNSKTDDYGWGMKYKGSGDMTKKSNWQEDPDLFPCYASTFTVNGQMFFGFEDWSYPTGSDMDLNDMVLALSGYTPTVINEDPVTNSWMLACEDLGGTFDRDYNDLVFKVEHVSGQTTARVTPLAAGGTLASYIFYVSPSNQETAIGEIHQLFGFAPETSGQYEPHNAGASRGTEGTTVTINVPEDWSMALYSTNTFGLSQNEYYNMGGFEIRTLPAGHEPIDNASSLSTVNAESSGASRIPAPDPGAAPYIICIPYSYVEENTPTGFDTEVFWAWPSELITIDNCYPQFPGWVSKHSENGEWYKRENKASNASTVNELTKVTARTTTKKVSRLGNAGDVDRLQGEYNLHENLKYANLSSGELTYFYKWTINGSEAPISEITDFGWPSERYIIVRQEADDNYEAGETMFKLTIRSASTLGNNGDITIALGETVNLYEHLTNPSAGSLSYSYKWNGADYNWNEGSITPRDPGDFIFTVKQEKDNTNYVAEGTTTFTIHVYQPVMFTTNNGTLALTNDNGALKLKNTNPDDNNQKWKLEDTGANLFLMYNIGSGKYLKLRSAQDGHGDFENKTYNEINADAFYRFAFLDDGRLQVREHNRTNHQLDLSFGTNDDIANNITVFLDKKKNEKVTYWTKENTSYSSSAKRRAVKKK